MLTELFLSVCRCRTTVLLSSLLHEEAVDKYGTGQGPQRRHHLPLPPGDTTAAAKFIYNILFLFYLKLLLFVIIYCIFYYYSFVIIQNVLNLYDQQF